MADAAGGMGGPHSGKIHSNAATSLTPRSAVDPTIGAEIALHCRGKFLFFQVEFHPGLETQIQKLVGPSYMTLPLRGLAIFQPFGSRITPSRYLYPHAASDLVGRRSIF